MVIEVSPSDAPCGARVRGVDLTAELAGDEVAAIRAAWLEHKVLVFPDQPMSDTDLERFTLRFGPFGHDPYFESIDGHPNIAAIHRGADEQAPVFADNWHADWTFQRFPPDGTCLHSRIIPPSGGNTEFADQQAIYEALPDDLREWADHAVAVHSARLPYAPDGTYANAAAEGRAMKIITDDSAYATETHPLVRVHPETGARTLYSCVGYIIGIEGHPDDEEANRDRLLEVFRWQSDPRFHFVHVWEPNMLAMWDNRCVLHRVTGSFDGYERLLHRTTIGYNADVRSTPCP